ALAGGRPRLLQGRGSEGAGRLQPRPAPPQVGQHHRRGARPPQADAAGRAGPARVGTAGRLPDTCLARPSPDTADRRRPGAGPSRPRPDLLQGTGGPGEAHSDGRTARRLHIVQQVAQGNDRRLLQARRSGRHRSHPRRPREGRACRRAGQREGVRGAAQSRSGQSEPALHGCVRGDRRGDHAPRGESRQQRGRRAEPDGDPLPDGHLGRRQFQGDPAGRHQDRTPGRPLRGHVRQAPRVQGPRLRLHDGHGVDSRAAAARERHGKLRQGGAAVAGAHRPGGLRSGQGAAVHRPVREAPRARARDAHGARCGTSAATACPAALARADRSAKPAMTTGAIAAPAIAVPRRSAGPWLVALAVVIPTFMEVLDTTIANVALRYIAGGLSAPVTDSEWVITSYLAAHAIILPISGWRATRLGRRNYFLPSIGVFTGASALCGMATSLIMLIGARVLQGLAGGGLQPSSQAVLLDAFPPERQGTAMTVFGMAALLAPVVGPTLGGYITDNYDWRWIFYLNVPVGLVALLMCSRLVVDPDYRVAQRAAARRQHQPFDLLGLVLLAVTMVCWEVMLSKGQEWDWLGDPFLRVQTLLVLFLVCLVALIVRQLRIANPLINFRTLSD